MMCIATSVVAPPVNQVILAAPVHERRHPKNFEVAIGAAKQDLAKRPTLMISVSLKAAFPEGLEEAQDYLTEMQMRTEFEPTEALLVAGAVRTCGYDYFQSQIIRHVVLDGQDVELIDGVREFTDWDALATSVASFLAT
jgi:menaquinone-dependent protoporphyrinogen oxidase